MRERADLEAVPPVALLGIQFVEALRVEEVELRELQTSIVMTQSKVVAQ